MKAPARFVATFAFARFGASLSQGSGLATRGASSGVKGTGAPSSRRAPIALIAVLAAMVSLVLTAAPALAAPPTVSTPVVSDVSYATATVAGKVSSDGSGAFGVTGYAFQYSTDNSNWSTASSETTPFFFGAFSKIFKTSITLPRGGTEYFVRFVAHHGPNGAEDEVISPGPNPSFTTLPVDPPENVSLGAPEVFSITATLSGKVKRPSNPDPAFDVKCRFEYVSDTQFQSTGFDGATQVPCEPSPVLTEAGVEKVVTAKLSGLTAATTYHQRLVTENRSPQVVITAPSTFTTAATVAKPKVLSVNDATEVSYRYAKLSGEIERPAGADPALDTYCFFEYVTDTQFGATGFDGADRVGCEQTPQDAYSIYHPLTTPGATLVTRTPLIQLKSGVTYHYRLTAENASGTDTKTAASTFTTLPGGGPTFTIDPNPVVVGYTTVELSGAADRGLGDNNDAQTYSFEVAEVGTEDWIGGGGGNIPQGPGLHHFSGEIGGNNHCCGLAPKPGTEYKYRLAIFRENGKSDVVGTTYINEKFPESPGSYPTFTTRPLATPTVALDPVTSITGTTARFSGTVDTHAPAGPLDDIAKAGYKTDWHIECIPACLSSTTGADAYSGTVQAEEGSKAISIDATQLEANTSYVVKLVAHNAFYSVETPVQFNTPLIKPTVKSLAGASDGKGGYVLQGIVNPNNSLVTDCKFEYGPNNTYPNTYSIPCSPSPGGKGQPVAVEGHVTGLTPDANYHAKLIATNAGGTADGGDQIFVPTLDPEESCPNQQVRDENSSHALPECRAYEMVTPPGKEGFDAIFSQLGIVHGLYSDNDRIIYRSNAGNLANSGQNFVNNYYVAARSAAGWETPSLNGSSGILTDAPSYLRSRSIPVDFSADLRSSYWRTSRKGDPGDNYYLRNPDGTFTLIGSAASGFCGTTSSADLSHLAVWESTADCDIPSKWGPGIWEYVGTGVEHPRRVDLDNSGSPVSECAALRVLNSMSEDGRVIFFPVEGGCGIGDSPPADEIWARVNGTTSFNVSASQCNRGAADPGGVCNAPANPTWVGAAKDGSRVFFTTTQQLLNGDTDQATDLYACDIPPGTPAPVAGPANSCSSLNRVSAGPVASGFENLAHFSDDGSAVYFVAKGVLAGNEDALGEQALAGDHNLYLWRTDAAHPSGQVTFVARLASDDLQPQTTPDGRYLVFLTNNQLLANDTDEARDLYRYDAGTGQLTRASTNAFGVGGNSDGFDVNVSNLGSAVSDDGQKIVFTTAEGLSAADGNDEPDAYLWTPARVFLISAGSVGGGVSGFDGSAGSTVIDGSGRNVYFETAGALTPADGDDQVDIYDARTGGGFSFAQASVCSGEACQAPPAGSPGAPTPVTTQAPAGSGNVKPCPKGKVAKGSKCVKKPHKKHSGKKHQGKKAAHKRGGGK